MGISLLTFLWERLILRPVSLAFAAVVPLLILLQTTLAWAIFPFVFVWKWLALKPAIFAVTIAVPLLIIGWHGLAGLRFAHWHKIADELGSVRQFIGNLLPNHAGTQVLAVQTMENGVGLYLCEAATGKRQLLMEQEEANYRAAVNLLGWSPDDRLFAFSQGKEISICNGKSGDVLAMMHLRGTNRISSFTWVSPYIFAFIDTKQNLFMVRQLPKKWSMPSLIYEPIEGQPAGENILKGLSAYGKDAVVWQQGDAIWSCNLNSGDIKKVWETKTDTLLDFSYSDEDYTILLHGQDQNGEFVSSYSLRTSQLTRLGRIGPRGDPSLYAPENTLLNVGWLNGRHGYAWLTGDGFGQDTLLIKTNLSADPVQLSWQGVVKSFWTDEKNIYVVGSLTNEPLSVWKYDPGSGALDCLVSDLDRPFKYAKNVVPLHYAITNASSGKLVYHVWPPINFSPPKKYPLVIGMLFIGDLANNQNSWQGYQEAIANAGGYFMIAPRGNSTEDMLAVYDALAKNPNIDTNQVYLLGKSEGTALVSDVIASKPELWRGAILFSPVSFPDSSSIRVSRILIDCGGQDRHLIDDAFGRLKQFQDSALLAGIPVTLAIHRDSGHIYRSFSAEKQRIRLLMNFLTTE
jgi:hypothetical protein